MEPSKNPQEWLGFLETIFIDDQKESKPQSPLDSSDLLSVLQGSYKTAVTAEHQQQ